MTAGRCEVCGQTDVDPLMVKDGHALWRCRQCGLVFVNPRPRQAALNRRYAKNLMSPFTYYRDNEDDDVATFRKRVATIRKYVRPGRLLDLGCATGSFMEAAKEQGFATTGIEVNKQSVLRARARGFRVLHGTSDDKILSLPINYFDVIVMDDFIEHMVSPMRTTRQAVSRLKRGGFMYIHTQDIGSLASLLLGRRWLHLKPEEHIYHFDKRSIRRLLVTCGLEVMRVRSTGRVRNAKTLALKLQHYSGPLSKVLMKIPSLEHVRLTVNLFDEMEVIARKPKKGEGCAGRAQRRKSVIMNLCSPPVNHPGAG
jgi:SAM-dependent methyltransferase